MLIISEILKKWVRVRVRVREMDKCRRKSRAMNFIIYNLSFIYILYILYSLFLFYSISCSFTRVCRSIFNILFMFPTNACEFFLFSFVNFIFLFIQFNSLFFYFLLQTEAVDSCFLLYAVVVLPRCFCCLCCLRKE